MQQLSIDEYQVGWICALPSEYAAAKAMLDVQHQMVSGQDRADSNSYSLGRIHNHNVVIACLPAGVDGTNAAAAVATNLSRTFRSIRFGLMVGIGGGIRDLQKGIDIRLGDVIVSQPSGREGGVVQYDKGKSLEGGEFVTKGQLNKPPAALLAALSNLRAQHLIEESQVPIYLEKMLISRPKMRKLGFLFPTQDIDALHCAHDTQTNIACEKCEEGVVKREPRESTDPIIHYGVVASGNQVIKSATHRDQLRDECGGAICVEMEAAGLMDNFPCLVIRGVCDYADSSKNDQWHNYASATAAAFAKELLLYVSVEQTADERPIQETLCQIDETLKENNRLQKEALEESRIQFQKVEARQLTLHEQSCLQAFKTSNYERFRDINPDRVTGTCLWVLDHPYFQRWHHSSHNDLLWISADPGCGKSVLSKSLVTRELAALQHSTTCYYFFKDNEQQDRLAPAICAVLHQLFSDQPHLVRYAIPAWEKNGDKIREQVGTMWQILLDAIADEHASDVKCVFDALDECHDDDRRELITRLCHFHEQPLKITGRATLKFLVTSRPYDTVQRWFEQIVSRLPQVRLRGEDENDCIHHEINLVIDQHIGNLAVEFSLSTQHQKRLRQRLQKMKHRTYLWLYLAVEEIRNKYHNSPDPEEELIDQLPTSVENAYEQILQKITNSQRSQARKILLIIVGARRPLTIGEVSLAFNADTAYAKDYPSIKDPNISHLESRIRDWCGLFVFINHSQLFLIHQTAKEFLLTDVVKHSAAVNLWKSSLLKTHVESEMATICITYLYLTQPKRALFSQFFGNGDTKSDFFEYCAIQWTSHLRDQTIAENEKLLNMVLSLYDTAREPFRTWFPINRRYLRLSEDLQIADQHAIAMSGHAVVLGERYKRQAFDVNLRDSFGTTPLIWAATAGHAETVQVLLEKGADVDSSNHGYSALYEASRGGHEKVVQMLLDKGAKVNDWRFGVRHSTSSTALHIASAMGHEKIVQMLIDAGADVNISKKRYATALHVAAQEGHEKIVQILIDAGADVNSARGSHGTALHRALTRGHERVVRVLLEAGATLPQPSLD